MNPKYFLLVLLTIILSTFSGVRLLCYAQEQDTTREFIDFRRTDPNNLPPIEKYAQPKEQVFPLGWRNSGTGVWTELNPKVPRVNYIGLHFANKDTGWACGGSGAIIKTTNGGNDWSISETPVTNLLLKIYSYNGQLVIATGYDGIILRSTDAGETFVQIPSNTTRDLWGVKMLNDTLGWVCGTNATLLKTTDAGQTWQPVNVGLNDHYWALDFVNENYGMIACGGGKVLKTINGGNSWTQIQAGDTRALFTIDIIDSLHIAAAGVFGKNVYSSDGGVNWVINPDIPAFSATNWIDFIDADTGYSVQDVTNIKKTTNRGQTWFNPTINNLENICEWHIQLLADGTGYACGEEIGGFYALNFYKRTNWLDNWSRIFLNVNWNDLFFINETKGFLISSDVSNGGLYKTEDGGLMYQKIENAPNGNDLFFLDSLTGFIAGTHKTTDGGETWYSVNGGGTKVFFINDQIGWSIGGNTIFKTIDVGENWFIQLTAPGAGSFSSLNFVDSLYGWASIFNRRPYNTTDSGLNWIEQTALDIWGSRDVLFKDYLNGFLLESNKLYITSDGGTTFNLIPAITGFSVAAKFSNYFDSTIFITGYKTFRSLDGGLSWFDFIELTGIRINGLSLLGMGSGFAVGEFGIVLSYYDETVPVELVNFTFSIDENKVLLNWMTATETNNLGFFVERIKQEETAWKTLTFVNGAGTSTNVNFYKYEDELNQFGKYKYRLTQVDYNGQFEYSNEIEIEYINKFDFYLSQNYPNPFNPITKIDFIIPEKTYVEIILYDITGKEVEKIMKQEIEAGRYTIQLNLSEKSSGIYFVKMSTINGFTAINKITLVK